MVTSPVIRKWFPGMISSITPYTLRSNIPEILANDVYVSTPCIYEDDNVNLLTKVHTLLPADAADFSVAGFAIWKDTSKFTYPTPGDLLLKYADDDIVTMMTIGDIAVYAEAPVKPGDDVYFRHTVDGGFTVINTYTNASDVGNVLIPGCKFVERTTAAGTTIINVNSSVS